MAYQSSIPVRQYWGLFVLFLSIFLIASDFTAFSPALPAIAKDFSVRISTVHWVVNAYALSYGVLIVTSGRLADIYGRSGVFLTGIIIFAIASLLGGFSSEVWVLFVSRALMGLGGALAWSAMLGMAYNILPQDRAGLVGGLVLAALGLATACGPVIGGLLVDLYSWRWILFINVPIAISVLIFYWTKYPTEKIRKKKEQIDYLGVLSLSLSLFLLLLAMDLGFSAGFSVWIVATLLIVSTCMAVIFITIEVKMSEDALIPMSLVKNRRFITSGLSVFFVAIAFFAILVYIPLIFIDVYGYSALHAGIALLPAMISSGVFAFVSGALYGRLGPKVLLCVGALAMSLGLFMLSVYVGQVDYLVFVPGMLLVGVGLGIFSPAAVTAAITAADSSNSSLSGAVIYMFRFLGGALGLGINSAILASAPDIGGGVGRALFVDGYIVLVGFFISLIYFRDEK
ncbi:MFS transporter [Microbulbifer sp. OS29]|uniref:MFS transporter n=1 Tax=Microbulbifer okhotskensis TaxID=2926617 RepID=A0A9X2J5X5_9GAMM|nr:MFS transporter [Microbulbifer okhotskensis]MCO1336027.1 MFS transporter [Microbulbifer okhotskensis]